MLLIKVRHDVISFDQKDLVIATVARKTSADRIVAPDVLFDQAYVCPWTFMAHGDGRDASKCLRRVGLVVQSHLGRRVEIQDQYG